MYLALSRAMNERRADAVTMDCLGMFYSGRVTAYPCLSHFQMNNDGSTGVCEGDLNSTCSQLMMRYLTGRPGYVSDPVIDTSKDEIIYAHCVSTNKVFGPSGKANPYIIRSHAEDHKGAVVQSLMPVGEPVTTLEADVWSKKMVIHTGQTTRNIDEPKACRTKLAAKANTESILNNWDMGWHRVTVYGDWRKQAMDLARLLGIGVKEEDKPA
jgi:L-fucose isomerase-like protein